MSVSVETAGQRFAPGALSLPWIIAASSVGTLIEWYDFYLYGVLALFFQQAFLLPGTEPDNRLYREPLRVLDGFPRSPVWRHPVRSFGRSDRPQIHLYAHPWVDGSRDLRRWPVARLCHHWGPCTNSAG